jgi:hypothetical protein
MSGRKFVTCLAVVVAGLMVGPALGLVITPNDDTHVERVAPDTVWNSMQVVTSFTSGIPNKLAFMEYTLGSAAATSAELKIFTVLNAGGISGYIYAREMDFDETTLTYNNSIGSDAPDGNTTNGYFRAANGWVEISPQPLPLGATDNNLPSTLKTLGATTGAKTMDVLAWYNINLGKTMTIVFQAIGPLNGNEVRWASKEHSTNPELRRPYIDVVEIPEPGSVILFGLAGLGMLRRRAA